MSEPRTSLDELFPEVDDRAAGSGDGPGSDEKPKRKRGLRIFFIVLGSLLVLALAAAGIGYAMLASKYNEVERVSIAPDPKLIRPAEIDYSGNAPINVLLLGADSRDALDHESAPEDLVGGFASDVIILAQISPDRKHLTLMSILRDNWVPIQGHGEHKINQALGLGGVPLAVNTIENFIGARVDHVAIVDFQSFAGLTDALGGVTIMNDQEFHNINGTGNTGKRYPFPAGEMTLDGDRAIAFVRERYSFGDGDYQRVRNQQTFLKGLMKQLLSQETLTSPDRLIGAFDAMQPYLILDEGLDLNTAVGLGLELRSLRSSDIQFFTAPTLGGAMSPDGQHAIVLTRWDDMVKVQEAIQNGTLHEFAKDLPVRYEEKPVG